MILNEINDMNFAFNEITGQLICFLRNNMPMTLIMGDSHRPEMLCQLLFNDVQIDACWSPMGSDKAITMFLKHTHNHI